MSDVATRLSISRHLNNAASNPLAEEKAQHVLSVDAPQGLGRPVNGCPAKRTRHVAHQREILLDRRWLLVAGILGASAVALGAFGAHMLQGFFLAAAPEVRAQRIENWHTAVLYHMYHSLALAVAATLARSSRWAQAACLCFFFGTLFFCGFLYAYALTGSRLIVYPVPFGGIAFIAGWLALAASARRFTFG